jgi:thiamine-monophosphate kinase
VPPAEQGSGEFALIRRFFSDLDEGPGVVLGVGDDAALLALQPGDTLAVSSDTQVLGRHFPNNAAAADVAYRAVAAAVSDLAAMGAIPLGMTLALTLPEADEDWLQRFHSGLAEARRAFELPLVGGDTTRGPLTITVTVLGRCPGGVALRRQGASPGDRLCVSGTLGDAAAGLAIALRQLTAKAADRQQLIRAFYRPAIPLTLAHGLRGAATAAIDISDGLLADARHLARASGVRLLIDPARVPRSEGLLRVAGSEQALKWALAGGDDYQLCFTLPEKEPLPAGCTQVGQVEAGEGVRCELPFDLGQGYEHFA